MYAQALESPGETGSGMASNGLLVNISPTTVAPVEGSGKAVASHPVRAASIPFELASSPKKSMTGSVTNKITVRPRHSPVCKAHKCTMLNALYTTAI